MELQIGQIVISLSGRDKGRLLVVTGREGSFILVCDGKERPLERPKKKNPKHIQATSMFIENDSMATNLRLRKKLRFLGNQGE